MKIISQFILTILFLITSNYEKAYSSDNIKIGLMIPLTGEYKEIGKSILNATKLAINKIDNDKVLIIPKDTKASPEITLKVAKELKDSGIKIVIGPLFNESLLYLNELDEMILNVVEKYDLYKKEYTYKTPIEYNRVEDMTTTSIES